MYSLPIVFINIYIYIINMCTAALFANNVRVYIFTYMENRVAYIKICDKHNITNEIYK